MWGDKPYHSLDFELKRLFGRKIYRIALKAGLTCPNRDGTKGVGGCIFCSEGGSGDFAFDIFEIDEAKMRVAAKLSGERGYIAYFQSYTNTYGEQERLKELFDRAACMEDVAIVAIGTRPDSISDDMLGFLSRLNRKKPVWVELGLQTIHEKTARTKNRCFTLAEYENAFVRLKDAGLTVITHVILGLPGESKADMTETVRYLARTKPDGVKLQLMHVLKGTRLCDMYMSGQAELYDFSLEEYVDFVIDLIELLPPEIVIHRITGDGDKRILVSPTWSGDKKRVLNTFTRRFKERGAFQGRLYGI